MGRFQHYRGIVDYGSMEKWRLLSSELNQATVMENSELDDRTRFGVPIAATLSAICLASCDPH